MLSRKDEGQKLNLRNILQNHKAQSMNASFCYGEEPGGGKPCFRVWDTPGGKANKRRGP